MEPDEEKEAFQTPSDLIDGALAKKKRRTEAEEGEGEEGEEEDIFFSFGASSYKLPPELQFRILKHAEKVHRGPGVSPQIRLFEASRGWAQLYDSWIRGRKVQIKWEPSEDEFTLANARLLVSQMFKALTGLPWSIVVELVEEIIKRRHDEGSGFPVLFVNVQVETGFQWHALRVSEIEMRKGSILLSLFNSTMTDAAYAGLVLMENAGFTMAFVAVQDPTVRTLAKVFDDTSEEDFEKMRGVFPKSIYRFNLGSPATEDTVDEAWSTVSDVILFGRAVPIIDFYDYRKSPADSLQLVEAKPNILWRMYQADLLVGNVASWKNKLAIIPVDETMFGRNGLPMIWGHVSVLEDPKNPTVLVRIGTNVTEDMTVGEFVELAKDFAIKTRINQVGFDVEGPSPVPFEVFVEMYGGARPIIWSDTFGFGVMVPSDLELDRFFSLPGANLIDEFLRYVAWNESIQEPIKPWYKGSRFQKHPWHHQGSTFVPRPKLGGSQGIVIMPLAWLFDLKTNSFTNTRGFNTSMGEFKYEVENISIVAIEATSPLAYMPSEFVYLDGSVTREVLERFAFVQKPTLEKRAKGRISEIPNDGRQSLLF